MFSFQASVHILYYDFSLIFFLFILDDDDGTYALAVANAVAEHALKTREEWQHEFYDEQLVG